MPRRAGFAGSEFESAGAAVAVGEQAGQGGDGDLGGIREPMFSPIGRCTRAISSAGTPSSVSISTCGPTWCGLPMIPTQRALVASASRSMTPSSGR